MPFKSKDQMKAAFAGGLGPEMKKKASTWAHETPNISKLPTHVEEEGAGYIDSMSQTDNYDHPGCEDSVGDIYIVLKPSPESSPEDLVHKTHAFGVHQFEPTSIHGVYTDEDEANLVAEAAHGDLLKHLRNVEKKKDRILDEIDGHIGRFQKEINNHMKEATEKPEEAEMHHHLATKKMDIIKNLRDKHKAVKASKKELPVQDEKPLKENAPAPSKPKTSPGPGVLPTTTPKEKPRRHLNPAEPSKLPKEPPKAKALDENIQKALSQIVKRYKANK